MWQAISYYGALALESLIGVFGVRLYEQAHYDVIDRIADRVEIRRHPRRLAVEVRLVVPGEVGRNEAFRLLFAYIAGAGEQRKGHSEAERFGVPHFLATQYLRTKGIKLQSPNGVVSSVSFVSTTNTARSLAGSVSLALALTLWRSPGSSEKLCPAL
jgi:hypothetical protein